MSNLREVVYNCRKATYLIDKKLIGSITVRESIELRIHLLGSSVCCLYKRQSQKINVMISQLLKTEKNQEIKLDEHFKQAMQVKIENRLNKN